jgi:hypothetical protein
MLAKQTVMLLLGRLLLLMGRLLVNMERLQGLLVVEGRRLVVLGRRLVVVVERRLLLLVFAASGIADRADRGRRGKQLDARPRTFSMWSVPAETEAAAVPGGPASCEMVGCLKKAQGFLRGFPVRASNAMPVSLTDGQNNPNKCKAPHLGQDGRYPSQECRPSISHFQGRVRVGSPFCALQTD